MSQPIQSVNPWWVGSSSNFVGSLISEPGWVDPLYGQPVVGRAGLGRVTRFDSSRHKEINDHCLVEGLDV